jgi:hypothetical protein
MRGWYSPPEYNGYDYVQDTGPTPPLDPSLVEGRTWYDSGANRAYVYDGSGWVELSITHHDNLQGINAGNHHDKTTEASEITDVSPDSDNNAHHSQSHDNTDHTTDYHPTNEYTPEVDTHDKTTTASELTDVSPDSDANAHHSQSHDNTDHTTNYLPDSDYTPESDTHDRPINVGLEAPVYQNTGDVPGDITEGEIVFISGDNSLYVEDGT